MLLSVETWRNNHLVLISESQTSLISATTWTSTRGRKKQQSYSLFLMMAGRDLAGLLLVKGSVPGLNFDLV